MDSNYIPGNMGLFPNQAGTSIVETPNQTDHQEDRFVTLERKLDNFQELARHIGVIASDFNQRNQDALNGKIYSLIHNMQELDNMKNSFNDVKVPIELLDILDRGENPQIFSKLVLERTLEKNKEVNGKIEIYKKFKAHLLRAFGEEMPDMVLTYRNMRETPKELENL
ncbi:unnamed protein product [Caenorhabditis bovis]|uniref:Mediator of RNA polymerase II transcription subunit 10 n=1 Tax=Caenorhabditis bovis TaxID=2654633 RepID=A0A8S1EXK6_9PELO|nr:unnamed protein product [Caenorhabditis bovis]